MFPVFPTPFGTAVFKPEGPTKPEPKAVPEPEACPLIFALFLAWFANFSAWLRKGEGNDVFSDNQSGVGSRGAGSSTGMGSHGVGSQDIASRAGSGSVPFSNEKAHNSYILSRGGKGRTYIIGWARRIRWMSDTNYYKVIYLWYCSCAGLTNLLMWRLGLGANGSLCLTVDSGVWERSYCSDGIFGDSGSGDIIGKPSLEDAG